MLIDVSVHNGNINWAKAKSAGVDGVIIRCGYGQDMTKQDDTKFKQNIEGALAQGIKVGIYLYSYAKTADGAIGEAKHAMRLAKPYKDKLYFPVFIDVEEVSTAAYSKTVVNAFCKELTKNGYKAGIYASSSWWKSYLSGVTGYTKWVAQWGSKQPSCDIWQYSSTGKVSGISGNVDMNKNISYSPAPAPAPTPTGGKVMVAMRVIKKGNSGEDVKTLQTLLKQKGYKGSNGKVLAIDGDFGTNCDYAVRNFQKAKGLSVDGIVGEKTWNKILNG